MRSLGSVLVTVAWLAAGSSVSADPPRFATHFKFEIKFVDGVQTYNDNQSVLANVWLPPDQAWQCLRLPVGNVEGRVRGSFACSNDGWRTEVLTMVGCKAGEADALRTAAMRLFAPRPDGKPQGWSDPDAGAGGTPQPAFGKYVDLAVSCETLAMR